MSDWNEILDCLFDSYRVSYFSGLSSLPHPSQVTRGLLEVGQKDKDLSQKVIVTSVDHVHKL